MSAAQDFFEYVKNSAIFRTTGRSFLSHQLLEIRKLKFADFHLQFGRGGDQVFVPVTVAYETRYVQGTGSSR